MALDAGSVFTILGGKFNAAGFREFDAANKKAIVSSTEAERSMRRFGESVPLKAMEAGSRASKDAERNLRQLGTTARNTAAVGIVAAGAALIYTAAKAASFNQEMLRLHTQAGATSKEVDRFKSSVLALAGTVPQGPKELSEGLYHIVSAGFRGAEALKILKSAAEGAALGNANLEDASTALVGTLASHIKGVHSAAEAQGQLNAIVGIGNLRFEDLAKSIGTGVLPTFAHAGLAINDFGAALATITDNATPANVTATRLRMTIALMAAPSASAIAHLKEIGLTSVSLAHDLRQPNGLLLAVEDLKTHLADSGKTAEEQDAILSHVFGGGKSSAVINTLIDETGRLRQKYKELGETNGVERLSKSWADFQKSEAGAFRELKSGAEAFAITVGDVVLPSLVKLSHAGKEALQGFVSGGGAKTVGNDLTATFDELGQVIQGVAPEIEAVAKALIDVGKAAGLGNAGEIAGLLAAFLTFKSLTFVAPILTAIAGGIAEIGAAAVTAESLTAFGGDLVALAGGPVGALVLGLSALVGAFVAVESGLFSSSSAAERNAAALTKDKQALEDLNNATQAAARSELESKQAKLDQKSATEQLTAVEKRHREGKASDLEVDEARLNSQRAGLHVQETISQQEQALAKEVAKAKKAENTAAKNVEEIENGRKLVENAKQRLTTQRELNKALEQQRQANAEISVAEVSRNRLKHGENAVTPANAQGVNDLQASLSGLPSAVVTRYELSDQGTIAKLGDLSRKLEEIGQGTTVVKILTTAPNAQVALEGLNAVKRGVSGVVVISIIHNARSSAEAMTALKAAVAGVPTSKIIAIETNAQSEAQKVAELRAQIAALEGKTLTITTVLKTVGVTAAKGVLKGFAAGRDPAVVGEGQGREYIINRNNGEGGVVNRPTLVGLGADDYVVPVEERFRGRALGLFASLARDLDVPGYKAGKKPKHHTRKHRPLPGTLDPLSLPVEDLESKTDKAKSAYEQQVSHVKQLGKKATGADKTKEQTERTAFRDLQRELREAKAYQARIVKEEQLANIAANSMRLADGRDDEAGYQAAKGQRLAALKVLTGLLSGASKHVKVDSAYGRKLAEQIGTEQLNSQGTEAEVFSDPAAEKEEQSGLTPSEEARLKTLEANQALAALTPGLGDDTTAAQQLQSFLEGVLGEAQAEPGPRGGDATIKALAESVKNARSNAESLTGGTAQNENQDLQAQITQANERTELANRTAKIAEQALEVFNGGSDLGVGSARGGGIVQNVYTLHPGDPSTLRAIGDAATAGIGLQGYRASPRIQVGP